MRAYRLFPLLALAMLIGVSRRLPAQDRTRCSADRYAAEWIPDIARIFTDSADAPRLRRLGVDSLGHGDTEAVVTDDRSGGRLTALPRVSAGIVVNDPQTPIMIFRANYDFMSWVDG